ncbi:hypothetical protein Ade02nite_60800 [Paractinoplanes deccanensis]|uniref:Ricin B lectin domain-containing protein n=1 Tax=Paractinoplanes deccanensis TaxID=113561 RepID=A0ABQ3YBP1_9ACTN|nr:ricin-type beta-trefoil lectin domain protein [Actinoplanes deccanensis]GID77439.1 hypothetical protein Ade02nite_60800 [Actinoplanes deccanensis]
MMTKFVRRAALPLIATALIVAGVAAPAHAADQVNSWRNLATGMCLDSNGLGQVYTMSCNNGLYQNWQDKPMSTNFRNHKNAATGNCLMAGVLSYVNAMPCDNFTTLQMWTFGSGYLTNVNNGYCLDSNFQGHVYAGRCNGGLYQQWEKIRRS